MAAAAEDTFTVNLRTLTGKHMQVSVRATESVDSLRRKVQALEGIPVDQQTLAYAGRRLPRSYFQVFGSMLDMDEELASELELEESSLPATVHLYIPEIEVVKKGRGQSWETRRFLTHMGQRDEYEVVRTVPAQWRTLTINHEPIHTLMRAIETEYQDAYIPKSTLTAQQVAAQEFVCPACTFINPVTASNCDMCDTANPAPYVDPAGEYAFTRMEFVPMAGEMATVVDFKELYKHENDTLDTKWRQPPGDEKASWMISLERPVQWNDEGERATLADYNIQADATLHIILNLRGD